MKINTSSCLQTSSQFRPHHRTVICLADVSMKNWSLVNYMSESRQIFLDRLECMDEAQENYSTAVSYSADAQVGLRYTRTRYLSMKNSPSTYYYFFSHERIKIMFVCVFLSSLSISPSWECRIKILALPIQTLPSSSKQKSIRALLCKNLQRNLVPRVALLSVSILVYLDLRIYTPLMEPKNAFGLKF